MRHFFCRWGIGAVLLFAEGHTVYAQTSEEDTSNEIAPQYTETVRARVADEYFIRRSHLSLSLFPAVSGFLPMETVHAIRNPWGIGGEGLSLVGSVNSVWNLGVGVSMTTSDTRRAGVEFSGRVTRQVSPKSAMDMTFQFTEGRDQLGVGYSHLLSPRLSIGGEAYIVRGGRYDFSGGYIIGVYQLTPNILAHVQFDYQRPIKGTQDAILTGGIFLPAFHRRFRLIIDHEWRMKNNIESSGVYVALQGGF